jgi:prepilin-type N-terminal cleavage/methylation domain-containing protein
MRKQKQQGFSLIELLIVVAIILIIAAIAIPNLVRAKMSANESSGAASVRSIGTAQVQYTTTYPGQGFAASLVTLGTGTAASPPIPCPAAGPAVASGCLVDGVLTAAATIAKSGYNIDTAGQGALPMQTFITQAGPNVYNRTGLRQFCAVEDGVLHGNPNTGGVSGLPTFTYAQCSAAAAPWLSIAN